MTAYLILMKIRVIFIFTVIFLEVAFCYDGIKADLHSKQNFNNKCFNNHSYMKKTDSVTSEINFNQNVLVKCKLFSILFHHNFMSISLRFIISQIYGLYVEKFDLSNYQSNFWNYLISILNIHQNYLKTLIKKKKEISKYSTEASTGNKIYIC